MPDSGEWEETDHQRERLPELAWASLKLGLTSFGGPIAHLGYFRDEYVVKRKWLDERSYADLVGLCQVLPGPASSQVGIGIGTIRAGMMGGIVTWLGFTLPSVILMIAFAFTIHQLDISDAGWVQGLKIVAVAVVAQAVYGMARQFCTDRTRTTIALLAAIAVLTTPTAFVQAGAVAAAGGVGFFLLNQIGASPPSPTTWSRVGKKAGITSLAMFAILLILALFQTGRGWAALSGSFFQTGSLVFGGGHVVLPLLDAQVVQPGWVTSEQFVAGYGAAQALPGPLFTFAAFLGAVRDPTPNGLLGAIVATIAIFLPSFLLIWGVFPFWESLRSRARFRAALAGVNAAVVGILLAALYDPVWTSAIHRPADVALTLACAGLLMAWKRPPWIVVVFAMGGGQVLTTIS